MTAVQALVAALSEVASKKFGAILVSISLIATMEIGTEMDLYKMAAIVFLSTLYTVLQAILDWGNGAKPKVPLALDDPNLNQNIIPPQE